MENACPKAPGSLSHTALPTSIHSLINADIVQFLQIVPLTPVHGNPLGHEVLIGGIHC